MKKPVSFVLNACRVASYVLERHIHSKNEGGAWALNALPAEFHGLILQALAQYRTNNSAAFEAEALEQFGAYVEGRLKGQSTARQASNAWVSDS